MHVSAKVDYGLRAMLELAARSQDEARPLVSAEELANAQGIPSKFLEGILNQLRRSGLVISRRGAEGGYRLAKPTDQITFAEVIRAIEGPLAGVRGVAPEDAEYEGAAEHMREVWIATRAALRDVLESVTLAGALTGEFDRPVANLLARPGAWERR
jgi:Rrf2 family protein